MKNAGLKTEELRAMSREALQAQVHEAELRFYALRDAVLTGKENNHAQLKRLRREIARYKTVLAKA